MQDAEDNQFILSWEYQPVDRFLIYKAANDEPLRLTHSVSGDQLYFIDKQIEVGTSYSYAVKAIFKNGSESPLSTLIELSN